MVKLNFVFQDEVVMRSEDGGTALVSDFVPWGKPQIFVRVQSWEDAEITALLRRITGRRARVTIEVLMDEEPEEVVSSKLEEVRNEEVRMGQGNGYANGGV